MRQVLCEIIQREISLVELSYYKTWEDYLGVTLIRSGDSVINPMKWVLYTNKGGTATYDYARPFRIAEKANRKRELFYCKDKFLIIKTQYLKGDSYEDNSERWLF